MTVSSSDSYDTFKTSAWNLVSSGAYGTGDVGTLTNNLYNNCYSIAGNKVALTGRTLALKMVQICANYGVNRTVYNQSLDKVIDAPALRAEYQGRADYLNINLLKRIFCCCCYCGSGNLSGDATSSAAAYLHAFPYPDNGTDGADINWRLIANVQPASLDEAVQSACDIMDANGEIVEFKISTPGLVTKPDSLIIYLKNDTTTYDGIRNAFQLAAANLTIQGTSAPMVNELAAGVAECSEPPWITHDTDETYLFSFGTYRCLLTALAYKTALTTAGNFTDLTEDAFTQQVDDTFDAYGVPHDNPHRQNAVTYTVGDAEYTAFMSALDAFAGVPDGSFVTAGAAFGNPPAII